MHLKHTKNGPETLPKTPQKNYSPCPFSPLSAKRFARRPKTFPKKLQAAQEAPGRPPRGPRTFPKRLQDDLLEAPRRPKRSQDSPQEAPRCPPERSQGSPKTPQVRPRSPKPLQDQPKTLQDPMVVPTRNSTFNGFKI